MQDTADRVHILTTQLLIDIKLNDICLHQIFVYFKSDKIISKSAGSNIRKMCWLFFLSKWTRYVIDLSQGSLTSL